MIDNQEFPSNYVVAEGPAGLWRVLDDFLKSAQESGHSEVSERYILYKLGDQKSFIKVDMSQKPYLFWYCDLLGRPATEAVKDTVARFLWEKCGEREHYLQESGLR